jgi:peptidoglycan/LPS O-acetylase OafA/YrhL
MVRSILGVIFGYLVFAISAVLLFRITNRNPDDPAEFAFVAFSIAYGACFGMLAGLIAARVAGRRQVLHAGIVAVLVALGAAISIAFHPRQGSLWTQLSAIFIFAPSAMLGGYVRSRTVRGDQEAGER